MAKLREQEWASRAMRFVRGMEKSDNRKELRQELLQLPVRIQTCGLGQTLAFYASKGSKDIRASIGNELASALTGGKKEETIGLLELLFALDAASYRAFTREALARAEWMKRYARALIED